MLNTWEMYNALFSRRSVSRRRYLLFVSSFKRFQIAAHSALTWRTLYIPFFAGGSSRSFTIALVSLTLFSTCQNDLSTYVPLPWIISTLPMDRSFTARRSHVRGCPLCTLYTYAQQRLLDHSALELHLVIGLMRSALGISPHGRLYGTPLRIHAPYPLSRLKFADHIFPLRMVLHVRTAVIRVMGSPRTYKHIIQSIAPHVNSD
jgi:hypothetical protein